MKDLQIVRKWYRYSDDMLDEFMRLESVAAQMKREPKETEKEQDTKMEERSINLRIS